MTYHEKLDLVLIALSKAEYEYFEKSHEIAERLTVEMSRKEVELLLEHLVFMGFATDQHKETGRGPWTSEYFQFRITIQGLLFLEKSSFKSEINKGKRMAIWITAKTIANIANACIIIIIGIASVYVSKQSIQKDEEIKVLNLKVDSLKTVKNSFKIDSSKRTKK